MVDPLHAIYWLWIVWYASWLASRCEQTALGATQSRHARPLPGSHNARTWASLRTADCRRASAGGVGARPEDAWVLFGLLVCTFAFCWWARIAMGRLWSGFISRTADHRVIDSGPFALVRHPIYSAIIFAAAVTAIAQGTAYALAGAAMFLLAFWMKARIEEKFLCKELGAEAYNAYRRRVPMLVPFSAPEGKPAPGRTFYCCG